MANPPPSSIPPQPDDPKPEKPVLRSVSSAEILGDDKEIQIVHESTCYRLRVTRQGKLILYK